MRFTIASTKDSTLGAPTASVITNIDSVSTPDSATAVFWFHARSPEQFYDAVYQNQSCRSTSGSRFLFPDGGRRKRRDTQSAPASIGSCAGFRAVVELTADTGNYRGRPSINRLIWNIAPDFNTAIARFLSGETDFFEQLRLGGM